MRYIVAGFAAIGVVGTIAIAFATMVEPGAADYPLIIVYAALFVTGVLVARITK